MKKTFWRILVFLVSSACIGDPIVAQVTTDHAASQPKTEAAPVDPKFISDVTSAIPPQTKTYPLYGDAAIPNSKPGPDEEKTRAWGFLQNVSRPTILAYLPAKAKANGASVLIFPGGGYEGLSMQSEGDQVAQFFQDHGVAAFVVKYRLPSDKTMQDKSIGPLQDAQQAIRFVRLHAKEWKLDPARVGAIGFSAGGHLASTLGTHYEKAYVDNPEGVSLRPDFLMLVYPVISLDAKITHKGSLNALLGADPSEELVRQFSNEYRVTDKTPPTLLLHAADDRLVDVDNSIVFFEALRRAHVPVQMNIFEKGEHGFFLMSRDEWQSVVERWLETNGWLRQ